MFCRYSANLVFLSVTKCPIHACICPINTKKVSDSYESDTFFHIFFIFFLFSFIRTLRK